MLFNMRRRDRIELSLEFWVPLSLVLLGRYADDILGPLLLCPFFFFGSPSRTSLLPSACHQLVRSLALLLVSPVSLYLSCDILDTLLKPVYLTSLVSLASGPLLDLILQLLLVSAQHPFMLLHLLVVVHEIHLHLK